MNRKALLRFSRAQKSLTFKFDEINFLKSIDVLYEELDEDAQKAWIRLWVLRYIECLRWLRRKIPKEDIIYEMAEMYMIELTTTPDGVTRYVYDAELLRKRDRLKEAIQSVKSVGEKSAEIKKALRFWSQMAQQYTDTVSDAAMIKAFEDGGVKKVRWFTQDDERVCHECDLLDGKVFVINRIPPKPHWRCRCWLEPVRSK